MWLLGTRSETHTRIAKVEKPAVDNLRKAAMFDVRLEALVHRRQHREEEEPWSSLLQARIDDIGWDRRWRPHAVCEFSGL